jgi:hypothetical protein
MAPDPINAFCDVCGASFRAVPARSFLGFRKMFCPKCQAEVVYPLTRGYRWFYGLAAVTMSLSFIFSLIAFHHLSMPGAVGCAMIFGLIKDRQIRKEIAEGEEARLRDAQRQAALSGPDSDLS